jgi:hypothetical protein
LAAARRKRHQTGSDVTELRSTIPHRRVLAEGFSIGD